MDEVVTMDKPVPVETKKPTLTYDIFFAPHATAEHVSGLKDHFQQADIFIPEMVEWKKEALDFLKDASEGKMELAEAMKRVNRDNPYHGAGEEILRLIHGSHKPVTFIDLPEGHPLIKDVVGNRSKFYYDMESGFSGNLNRYRENIGEEAELEDKRELYMLEQLPIKIEDIIESNPELRGKSTIRVLIQLGAAHGSIYHRLKAQGAIAERTYPTSRYTVGDFRNEAIKKAKHGKSLTDELVARVMLQKEFDDVYTNPSLYGEDYSLLTRDPVKMLYFKRYALSQFSLAEIEEMFTNNGGDSVDFFLAMEQKLRSKGIHFPKNERELDEIVKKYNFNPL